MADVSAHNFDLKTAERGVDAFPITDEVTLYIGALAGAQAGFANHWAAGVNDLFLGAVEGGDDTLNRDGVLEGEADLTPDPEIRINTTGLLLQHLDSVDGTPAQSKVGNQVYCSTSNIADITLDPAGTGIIHPIGYMQRFRSTTDVDVRLFTPTEYLAARGSTYVLTFQLDLNSVTAADTITDFAIPHRFKIIDWQFVASIPGTAAKNATFTLEIGSTAITGASLLLDDNIGTIGIVIASTAITALNVGAAADTLTMVAGTVTTFTVGSGTMCITVQDLGL